MSPSKRTPTAGQSSRRARNLLLVDDREKRLPAGLYPRSFQVVSARLLTADVVVLHAASYAALANVEVKSPADLFTSYATGRLFAQLRNMTASAATQSILAVVGGRLDSEAGVFCDDNFENKRLQQKYPPNLLRLQARTIDSFCKSQSVPIEMLWFETPDLYFSHLQRNFKH